MAYMHKPDPRDQVIGVVRAPGAKPDHVPTVLMIQYLHHGEVGKGASLRRGMLSFQMGNADTPEPEFALILGADEAERVVGWLVAGIALCRENNGQEPATN